MNDRFDYIDRKWFSIELALIAVVLIFFLFILDKLFPIGMYLTLLLALVALVVGVYALGSFIWTVVFNEK